MVLRLARMLVEEEQEEQAGHLHDQAFRARVAVGWALVVLLAGLEAALAKALVSLGEQVTVVALVAAPSDEHERASERTASQTHLRHPRRPSFVQNTTASTTRRPRPLVTQRVSE